MSRTIVISDVHGYCRTFEALLFKVSYCRKDDRLILLGDYVDGGPAALDVVRMVRDMVQTANVHAIGGNHDDMFLNWLDDNDFRLSPYTNTINGGVQTIRSFCPWYESGKEDEATKLYIKENYAGEIEFLRQLPNFIEDSHHIYVHAGIDLTQSDWKQTSRKDFRWIRGKFHNNDMRMHTSKTIVFGHEVCARLHKDNSNFTPWFGTQRIGIDGGIKFGYFLNALIIGEDGQYSNVSLKSCD